MEFVKIKDLFTIKKGKKVEQVDKQENTARYIQIDDLRNNDNIKYCDPNGKYVYAEENDIIIAWDGANAGTVGYGLNGAIGSTLALLTKQDEKLDSEYCGLFLKSKFKYLRDKCTGATIPHISKNSLEELKIPILELEEQLKIVNIINCSQKLIDKRKEQIGLLDELVKSRFIEMFGDPSKNEKGWEVSEIGKYLNILTDYHSNGSYETLRDNVTLLDIPSYALMVRTTDLENNNFKDGVKYIDEHAYNHLEKSKVFGGEIIINKIGSAGKVYLMPFLNRPVSLAMNQFLLRFDENKVNHIFLYNLLSTPYMVIKINEKVRGAVTKTITKDAIREINIIVPPVELQNQFVDFVKQVDKLKFEMEKSLKELEDNFNSLMQKAFKGELF